ncbi:hypothetical protein COOONC_20673 [Cooperia oncophora]
MYTDFDCVVCGVGQKLSSLYKHLRHAHGWTEELIKDEKIRIKTAKYPEVWSCDQCDKRLHGTGPARSSMVRVLCPKCSERFRTHRELAQHCGSSHSDENVESPDFSVFSGSFSSMKDFEVWKTSLEKSTFAKFSKRDSKPRKNGRKHLYLCRHARGPKADIGAEVRHVHSKSKRIQSHCPAHLKVFERNDGTVVYEGCAGHLGHEINAASLRSRAKSSRNLPQTHGSLSDVAKDVAGT